MILDIVIIITLISLHAASYLAWKAGWFNITERQEEDDG